MIINEFFTGLLGGLIVVKHVEGVMLLIFGIDPIAGEAAPRPLLLSCIMEMDLIIASPLRRLPSLAKIPETAQPDGILTCPSLNMASSPFVSWSDQK